ncbi:uncharacterized protein LOC135085693 isoform X2 [Ostrinia nubilalis]|uniref:uncharacterized protein LOC135085693 isoform X2 n=1 Tax=Ostrinia nubilalis TaxID=29057 RepID=UPI00308258B0
MPWKRPDSVPKGQVWSTFKGRDRDGKPGLSFQIRDMEDEYKEQCLDLMQETFMRDEPLCKILDIKSDPTSIRTIRDNWEAYMSQGVSLACFTEEDGKPGTLVGFNIVLVKSKDDPEEDMENVKGESWKKLLKTLVAAEDLVDVFDHYGVDRFLTSSGLTVLPEFRGQNIGGKIFAAREPLCKALGIKATATVFTAITSQVLAAKCGYEVLAELPYSAMMKQGIDLTDCECKTAKLMGRKFT